ncbi:hypothetical protein ACFE04_006777 [Oxalis oulophora]
MVIEIQVIEFSYLLGNSESWATGSRPKEFEDAQNYIEVKDNENNNNKVINSLSEMWDDNHGQSLSGIEPPNILLLGFKTLWMSFEELSEKGNFKDPAAPKGEAGPFAINVLSLHEYASSLHIPEFAQQVLNQVVGNASYPAITDREKSKLHKWTGDANTFNKFGPHIELVTTPNNTAGHLRQSVVNRIGLEAYTDARSCLLLTTIHSNIIHPSRSRSDAIHRLQVHNATPSQSILQDQQPSHKTWKHDDDKVMEANQNYNTSLMTI